MSAARWTVADVPPQAGRTVVITGANTGLGFEAAKALAGAGATVVLACRDLAKADRAAAAIGGDRVQTVRIDLASLESVRDAAAELAQRHPRLDLLINNAGLMWPPFGQTADGFELQFGTNHLGHFALTGLLLPALLAVPGSRVVTVSSMGHRTGRIDFDNLQAQRHYGRHDAYARSKLANLMFTYELQRRLAAAGAGTIAVAAHPGGSRTELSRHSGRLARLEQRWIGQRFSQDAAMGALPILRAAVDPDAAGGDYYGPGGWLEVKGFPRKVRSSRRSHDVAVQRRLWTESERLTGVVFEVAATAS
ncbi:MAG TPA: oxidoreductase [Pseudonocardiaceae bacterium]|nr:oxidoreductase [Pseudonocardiaceae bacterium]